MSGDLAVIVTAAVFFAVLLGWWFLQGLIGGADRRRVRKFSRKRERRIRRRYW